MWEDQSGEERIVVTIDDAVSQQAPSTLRSRTPVNPFLPNAVIEPLTLLHNSSPSGARSSLPPPFASDRPAGPAPAAAPRLPAVPPFSPAVRHFAGGVQVSRR
jgi:hypothetical protein